MRRASVAVVGAVLFLGAGALLIASGAAHRWLVARGLADPSPAECAQVLAFVIEQELPPGSDRELALPPRLHRLAHGGVVQAARKRDGGTCVLLKRHVGWKGNFTGTLFCDRPLAQGEIIRGNPLWSDYISLAGTRSPLFNELYVGRALDDRSFRVFFDLH
jgi:hypothetical protein